MEEIKEINKILKIGKIIEWKEIEIKTIKRIVKIL
jgi:hypothetical protein